MTKEQKKIVVQILREHIFLNENSIMHCEALDTVDREALREENEACQAFIDDYTKEE